ncbi:MAG: protein kinase [Myxococcota bacterium]
MDDGARKRLSSIEEIVAESVHGTRPIARTETSTDATSLPPRYEDLGRIASGGMGEVRRARDRSLNRTVAHWEHLESALMQTRFQHEVAVTASLQHPGIVPIHDQGILDDGRPWFSMQEVRGRTLDEVIQEVHRTADRATLRTLVQHLLSVLLRVAETMAYAHSLGVVHRDLKPHNLMVGEFGEALVMDWGIARRPDVPELPDAGSATITPLTQAGDIVGTLSYMAPEQARSEEVSASADVFSLGLVLFEALTGTPAVDASAPALLARFHTKQMELRSRLERDSAVVSDELISIVERATKPDASERYADAAALAADLRSWLDGAARRQRARAALADAKIKEGEVGALRNELKALQSELEALNRTLQPFDDVPAKLPLWKAEDRIEELRDQLEQNEAQLIETLRLALQYDPELDEANRALASIARRKAEELEDLGDIRGASRWLEVLQTHTQ